MERTRFLSRSLFGLFCNRKPSYLPRSCDIWNVFNFRNIQSSITGKSDILKNSCSIKLNKFNSTYFDSKDENALNQILNSMYIIPDFISQQEEQLLLEEIENVLKRIRYEKSHWDDAIHNYRETEHIRWKPDNAKIIERVRQTAFSENTNHIKYVHILDIAQDGFIKPHVDSIRFCGNTISGISLLSDSVMRLRLEENRSIFVDVLLNQRSLYIMTGDARYKYAHEVLDNQNSYFCGKHIERNRRISVICRNEPPEDQS